MYIKKRNAPQWWHTCRASTGAFVPHSLALMQFSADMALNEAKAILIADCENGGGLCVMIVLMP
ncbi:hypothetical protein EB657_18270 [Escherichia coli]|nr:hypothetical protein [Escherichia coli]